MKKTLTGLLLLLMVLSLFAAGGREKERSGVELTGRLSVKGNEPFTFLTLTTEDSKVYELSGPKADELRRQQGRGRVTLRGERSDKTPPFGTEAVIIVETYSF